MITIVTGPPAAGKSTLVAASAAPGDVVIDFDAIAVAVGSPTPHAAKGAVREVAHEMRRAAISRVLSGIDAPSWIIHSWPSSEQLEAYSSAGALFVEVDPGVEEVLSRAAAENRPDETAAAILAWYEKRGKKAMTNLLETTHRTKAFSPLRFKAEGEDDGFGGKLAAGEFVALASVFDVIDSYGDRIIKGAFAETLAAWQTKGDPIPVIWQHAWSDPSAHIGFVVEARETDEGLLYKARLDLDEPFATKVYKLMKSRRVTQQSFGFDVVDGRSVTEAGREIFEITKVNLYEVGPCLVGVNQATNLLDIKSGSAGGAPAPAAEPSGQATPAAVVPSKAPSSDSESTASRGFSPASAMLLIEIENLEVD